jgi:hypothetical protein
MIPQIISKLATFRPFNLSTEEIVAAIHTSFVCPRNMILDILTLQKDITESEIIAVVGLRETKGLYAEQLPIRNEAKQVSADAKLAVQLDAKLNGVQACHRLKLVTGIASSGSSSPSASSAPVVLKASPAKSTTMSSAHSSSVVPLLSSPKRTYGATAMQKKLLSGGIPNLEEEATEVEECTIDGKTYLKDEEGVIYDFKTEDPVGKYNFKTKKWIIKWLMAAHNPPTAASASSASSSLPSSSVAAKYDKEDRALMAVRAEKNRKFSFYF